MENKKNCDLDNLRFFLYRRGCYLDELVRFYCEKRNKAIENLSPLFDCLVIVQLQSDASSNGLNKPFIIKKYPPKVNSML